MNNSGRKILSPFNPREAISTADAATRSGKTARTIRHWCSKYGIGRKIAGEMHVSRAALDMLLESDLVALAQYHNGDRDSEIVRQYLDDTRNLNLRKSGKTRKTVPVCVQ